MKNKRLTTVLADTRVFGLVVFAPLRLDCSQTVLRLLLGICIMCNLGSGNCHLNCLGEEPPLAIRPLESLTAF